MEPAHLRFALPAATVAFAKLVMGKKSGSQLRVQALDALRETVIAAVGDRSEVVCDILAERKKREHNAIIRSIAGIGGKAPEAEEKADRKNPGEKAPGPRFAVKVDEVWLSNTEKKLRLVIQQLLDSISQLDLEYAPLRAALLAFASEMLKSCSQTLAGSDLLKLLFIAYFSQSETQAGFLPLVDSCVRLPRSVVDLQARFRPKLIMA